MLNTPILFLVFNRPDTTKQVFEKIREAKPKQLFVVADGPRTDKLGEADLCEETRRIATAIDWDCKLYTLFRENNLGCKHSVSNGISWFFDQVEEGIILEDDCLPADTFFSFCEMMLHKYRDQEKVVVITGTNYFFGKYNNINSYYFSNFAPVWGWASWKRVWKKYSLDFPNYDEFKNNRVLEKKYTNKSFYSFLNSMIEATRKGVLNTWDSQLVYLIANEDGLVVVPYRNLIKNIGYIGTHKFRKQTGDFFEMPVKELDIKCLSHPPTIEINKKIDNESFKKILQFSVNSPFYALYNAFKSKAKNILDTVSNL